MYEVEVKLSFRIRGEILAHHVVDINGMVIVGKNTVLNDYIIHILQELGIQRIWIYKNTDKEGRDSRQNRSEKPNDSRSVSEIRAMIHNLSSGTGTKHETISSFIKPLYKALISHDYIVTFMRELHKFDDYTYSHSINVAFYAMLIAEWLNMPSNKLLDIVMAGLLHDIGKIKIEKCILNKKDQLTDLEFATVKQHSSIGYEMLRSMNEIATTIKEAILYHHERIDGSGYPSAATGEYISEYAKIIAIADVYDAMTSDRAYKKKVTPFQAFHMFTTDGQRIFDASIVDVFLLNLSSYLVGATVLLDNGTTAEVVYINPQDMDNPIVRIKSSYQRITIDSGPQIISILEDYNFDDSQLNVINRKEATYIMNSNQYIVFMLNGEEYGLDISYAQEIIRVPNKISAIPNVPSYVEGVISLRDKVIPVIDLKKRFDFEQTARTPENRLLIVDLEDTIFAIIVDDVSEIIPIDDSVIEKLSSAISRIGKNSIKGIGKLEKRLIVLLDALMLKVEIFKNRNETEEIK